MHNQMLIDGEPCGIAASAHSSASFTGLDDTDNNSEQSEGATENLDNENLHEC